MHERVCGGQSKAKAKPKATKKPAKQKDKAKKPKPGAIVVMPPRQPSKAIITGRSAIDVSSGEAPEDAVTDLARIVEKGVFEKIGTRAAEDRGIHSVAQYVCDECGLRSPSARTFASAEHEARIRGWLIEDHRQLCPIHNGRELQPELDGGERLLENRLREMASHFGRESAFAFVLNAPEGSFIWDLGRRVKYDIHAFRASVDALRTRPAHVPESYDQEEIWDWLEEVMKVLAERDTYFK